MNKGIPSRRASASFATKALMLTASLSLIAATSITPKRAEPEAFAKEKPLPAMPQPEPFGSTTGFNASLLDAYSHVLERREAEQFVKSSRLILKSQLMETVRGLIALTRERSKDYEDLEEIIDDESTQIFSYTIPNDPTIMLGMAKSRDGDVTAPPRLVTGSMRFRTHEASKKKTPDASRESDEDEEENENWYMPSPEQVCTHSLAYSLTVEGGPMFNYEHTPPPVRLDPSLLYALLDIENSPNPILKGATQREAESAKANPTGEAGQVATEGAPEGTGSTKVDFEDAEDYAPKAIKALSKGEIPLEQFIAAFGRDYGRHPRASKFMREFSNITRAIPDLKRECEAKRLVWTEAKRVDNDTVNLMSCSTGDGRQVGLGARLVAVGGFYPDTLSIFHEDKSGLGVEVRVDFNDGAAEIAAYRDKEYLGPAVHYDEQGRAFAVDFNLPENEQAKRIADFFVYEWHENGRLKLVSPRKSGVRVGEERTYYASGALAGQVIYGEGAKLVSYKEWYENHRPAEVTGFKDGKMHGTRRWWHQNGEQAGEMSYDLGLPDGAMMMWYDTGARGVSVTFARGELAGDVKWLYDDGGVMFEGKFTADQPSGVQKLFLSNGQQLSERHYKNGEPDGAFTVFDQEGRPSREVAFKKGEKDGKSVVRYPDGALAVEMNWQGGQLDGPVKSYYKNGQLAATCSYDHDKLTEFTRHHPTGEIQLEGKVLDPEKGVAVFQTSRTDGTQVVDCQIDDFEIKACRLFDTAGQEIALPGYATLTKRLTGVKRLAVMPQTVGVPDAKGKRRPVAKETPAPAWAPDRCGGYVAHYNFDPIINSIGDGDGELNSVSVTYETKDECADKKLANAVYCTINIEGSKAKADPCVATSFNDRETELVGIIDEMEDPEDGDAEEAPAH